MQGKFSGYDGRKFYYDTRDQEYKEEWRVHGQLHRVDGPAFIIYYYPEFRVATEEYWDHGSLHREEGPAMLYYTLDGHIFQKRYYHRGELHRTEGPAQTHEEDTTEHRWYLHDIELAESEHKEYLKLPERELFMRLARRSNQFRKFGLKMKAVDSQLSQILLATDQIL